MCAVKFGWPPSVTAEEDMDTLWGVLAVMPEIVAPDSTESVVSWYKRQKGSERGG